MDIQSIISRQKAMDITAIQSVISGIQEETKGKENWDKETLLQILRLIDLTTLEGNDTVSRIQEMCDLAKSIPAKYAIDSTIYSICVYPSLVKAVQNEIKGTNIKIASVACAFPSGQLPLHLKLEEVKYAIAEGADEIDMVISRGEFLSGNYALIFEEVKAVKAICGENILLKVILETGELETLENIRLASDIAIEAGADFIKTSTGKISQGASLEAIYVMCTAIKDYYERTGKIVGVKASGGVRTVEDAVQYMRVIETVLGKEWLVPLRSRFGASSLTKNVLAAL